MFQDNVINNCPELFIEILRFVPGIQDDLLSLIIINKQCHQLLENNTVFYELLCKDRFEQEVYEKLKEEEELDSINWKDQFLNFVLFSWSEYLQTSSFYKINSKSTTQPAITQVTELESENITVKCIDNACLLISNGDEAQNDYYRYVRSKYPILKDTTLHYYIKHLKKPIKHGDDNFLLFGVMNEQICNTIVGKQKDYSYLGEMVLRDNSDLYSFNTSYSSNGYISSYEKYERKASEYKEDWNKEDVISVEVKGIEEGNIKIKYYLNYKFVYEVSNILKDVDIINCKENRLYFIANFYQSANNFNNTVVIGSTQKMNEQNLLNQFNNVQKNHSTI